MKAYYYGEPEFFGWVKAVSRWAKKSPPWGWRRWVVCSVMAPFLFIALPLAWLCVKAGNVGHWLAFGIGIDSHDAWEGDD